MPELQTSIIINTKFYLVSTTPELLKAVDTKGWGIYNTTLRETNFYKSDTKQWWYSLPMIIKHEN